MDALSLQVQALMNASEVTLARAGQGSLFSPQTIQASNVYELGATGERYLNEVIFKLVSAAAGGGTGTINPSSTGTEVNPVYEDANIATLKELHIMLLRKNPGTDDDGPSEVTLTFSEELMASLGWDVAGDVDKTLKSGEYLMFSAPIGVTLAAGGMITVTNNDATDDAVVYVAAAGFKVP